jgi:Thiolase, C-terminal domain
MSAGAVMVILNIVAVSVRPIPRNGSGRHRRPPVRPGSAGRELRHPGSARRQRRPREDCCPAHGVRGRRVHNRRYLVADQRRCRRTAGRRSLFRRQPRSQTAARFRALPAAGAGLVIQFTAVLDTDLFEVHEAFAWVLLLFRQEFGIADDVPNVSGGAIAIGRLLGSAGRWNARRPAARVVRSPVRPADHLPGPGAANITIIDRL